MTQIRSLNRVVFAIVLGTMMPGVVGAQGLKYVKAHYTKYEYRIPMRAGEQLSFNPPSGNPDRSAYDEYISNPAKPVPYISGIVTGMKAEYMIADQRFASRRSDVLVYQTGELEQDVTLVGSITVDLVVSTSGTDSDWVLKLIAKS